MEFCLVDILVLKYAGELAGRMVDGHGCRQMTCGGPADEGDGEAAHTGPVRRPGIEVALLERCQGELAGVESGEESDGCADVAAVALVGAEGVAASCRASAGVADHVPFGERSDLRDVVGGEGGDGSCEPVGEESEVLVALGQDARGHEQAAHVRGRGSRAERVQRLVTQLLRLPGEVGEELCGGTAPKPLKDGLRILRLGEDPGDGGEGLGQRPSLGGEQLPDAGCERATRARSLREEVGRPAAIQAQGGRLVGSAAGDAQAVAGGCPPNEDARLPARRAGLWGAATVPVAAVADRAQRPEDLDRLETAADPAAVDRPRGTTVNGSPFRLSG